MTQRYPRSARLTEANEFTSVFGHRCIVRSVHFSVFAKPNVSSPGRLGIAISRRVAARAVDRNYMKRVVREIFRRNKNDFHGLDVVVQSRQAFAPDVYLLIESEFLATAARIRAKCLTSC